MREYGIRLQWNHQAHIYTCKSCCLQSKQDRFCWQKIWCLYIKILFGSNNGLYQTMHDIRPRRSGFSRHYLSNGISQIWQFGEVIFRCEQFFLHIVPIEQECRLKSMHRFSDYLQVRISPNTPFHPFDITICQIHASYKPNLPIDNSQFPVVSIVNPTSQNREIHF